MSNASPSPTASATDANGRDARKPDFLVIGAQKCATSWLYLCLRDHPAIHLPVSKREVEYLGGDLYEERGEAWYYDLLAGATPEQVVGDVSVDYLWDPRGAAAVERHVPGTKLIAVLRNPVQRAISSYLWYVRRGRLQELDLNVGFEQALAEVGEPGSSEEARVRHQVVARGYYDEQLARYLAFASPGQVMVVAYEEIAADAQAVLRRIYSFLGVDSTFVPPSLSNRAKQNSYNPLLLRIEHLAPRSWLLGHLVDRANQWLRRFGKGQAEAPVAPALYRRLEALYAPHIEATDRLVQALPAGQRPTGALRTYWTEASEGDE